MMIEIKDAAGEDEDRPKFQPASNQILTKYTLNERIYEEVYDFRLQQPQIQNTGKSAGSKNQAQGIQQKGIIMTIDLQKMN